MRSLSAAPGPLSTSDRRERLRLAMDSAQARLSVPSDAPGRRWIEPSPWSPAVPLDLWLAHVVYSRSRSEDWLSVLVNRYRSHAEAEARRHYRRGEPLEDLIQVAMEALLLALRRFDPNRGIPFLAFAKPTIVGSLRRHYRDAGWALRVPRRVHELSGPVREATDLLCQDLGRSPTPAEIADFLGLEEKEILEAMAAGDARMTSSFDATDRSSGLQAEQVIGADDKALSAVENRTALAQCLELLPESDRQLLGWYFFADMTQTEIAARLGCSQMQVSRLLARAVRNLRRRMLG